MTTFFIPQLGLDGTGPGRRDRGLHGSRLSFPSREDGGVISSPEGQEGDKELAEVSSADRRRGTRQRPLRQGRSRCGAIPTRNPAYPQS